MCSPLVVPVETFLKNRRGLYETLSSTKISARASQLVFSLAVSHLGGSWGACSHLSRCFSLGLLVKVNRAIKDLGGKRPSRETSNREATVMGGVMWSVVAGLEQGRAVSTLRMIGGGGLGAAGYRSELLQAVAVARQATRQLSGVLSVDEAWPAKRRELSTR